MIWTVQHTKNEKVIKNAIGFIPSMLREDNPKSAVEQLHEGYAHGGGWRKMDGWTLNSDNSIFYPGDPSLVPFTWAKLRDELILVYPHAWVAVVQPDRSFEIARMD